MTHPQLTKAAILSIGTELTRGEIVNTNASWLSDQLTAIGLEVIDIACVPDHPDLIRRTLERLSTEAAVVVTTGGLGPTTDDLTTAVVAEWLGVRLERDARSYAALLERYARAGRTPSPSNAKQADFPLGASVLDNPHGTAPGFSVRRGSSQLFFMPGVPREMKPMFESYVAPAARSCVSGAQHQIRLRCFGLPESVINDRLVGVEAQYGIELGYRVHFPEVQVKVLARELDPGAATALAEQSAKVVRDRLGPAVYAEGEKDLPQLVAELCRSESVKLALAESCTGGLVSSLLCAHPVSDFYQGGMITYSNALKERWLGVESDMLSSSGAVSAEVACAMASGALERSNADLAVSVTGIAGPTGATETKPIGLVYIAIADRRAVQAYQLLLTPTFERQRLQILAAWSALTLIRRWITGEGELLGATRCS